MYILLYQQKLIIGYIYLNTKYLPVYPTVLDATRSLLQQQHWANRFMLTPQAQFVASRCFAADTCCDCISGFASRVYHSTLSCWQTISLHLLGSVSALQTRKELCGVKSSYPTNMDFFQGYFTVKVLFAPLLLLSLRHETASLFPFI